MSNTPKQTIITEGMEFEGTVKSKCAITLGGAIKGVISAPSLTVQKSGTVDGRIEVDDLTSEGEISGQIKAKTVCLAGRIADKTVIRAETLAISLDKPGEAPGLTFGNCELYVGDKAAKQATSPPNESKKAEPTGPNKGARL